MERVGRKPGTVLAGSANLDTGNFQKLRELVKVCRAMAEADSAVMGRAVAVP